MSKTKKNYKKNKTIRKRKSVRGAGFTEKLRGKTRNVPRKKEPKRTINKNRRHSSNTSFNISRRSSPVQDIESSIIIDEKDIPNGKNITIVYPTGHIYKGDFNKGKKEGTGTLKIKDGPTYQGEWKDDKFVPFSEWKIINKNK